MLGCNAGTTDLDTFKQNLRGYVFEAEFVERIKARNPARTLDRDQTISADRSSRFGIDHYQVPTFEVVRIKFESRRIAVRKRTPKLDTEYFIAEPQGRFDLDRRFRKLYAISSFKKIDPRLRLTKRVL